MICSRCGKEVPANSKFCVYCGAPVESTQSSTPPTPPDEAYVPPAFAGAEEVQAPVPKKKRKSRKGWLALVIVLVVVAAAGVVGFQFYTSPSAEFTRSVKAGDLDRAYELYEQELRNKGLSETQIQLLVDAAVQTQEAYMSDEISYDEASNRLEILSGFSDSAVAEAVAAAQTTIATKHQIEDLLQAAEKNAASGDYLMAIENYQAVLEIDPSSEKAKNGLESAEAAYQQSVVDEAYKAKDAGEWDTALEILDTYQATYGENEKIAAAYDEIEKQRPITLKNLTMVSSEEVEVMEEAVKDRWDNLYDGAVKLTANLDGYGYYSLEKKYTKFTGVIFVSSDSRNGVDMSVTIYKDNEIVYHLDNITENTPPASFEVDLTDASTLKIVTANESTAWGYLLFGNTAFEKAE